MEHAKNCAGSFGSDLPLNLRPRSIWISAPSGRFLFLFFFPFNLAEDGSPCLAQEIPAHVSQSYQSMRHYIMAMSQTLTKPAWPRATTCVTTAGWKYHSTIPLPPLYFGMTKRQFVGRAQNHKASTAGHIVGFVLPAALLTHLPPGLPPQAAFIPPPSFCQKPMIKCTHLDLYSSIVL